MIKTFAQLKKIAATSLTLAAILLSNTAVAENIFPCFMAKKEGVSVKVSNVSSPVQLDNRSSSGDSLWNSTIVATAYIDSSKTITAPTYVGFDFEGWYGILPKPETDSIPYYTTIPTKESEFSQLLSLKVTLPLSDILDYASAGKTRTKVRINNVFWAPIYLKYTEATYNVTFVNGSGEEWNKLDPIPAKGGAKIKLPSVTGLTSGVSFYGWYSDSELTKKFGDAGKEFQPTKDITLYAKLVRDTYTVIFDANGGTGTMSDKTMPCGKDAALTKNAFTRTGYSFLGWATTRSATSATYSDGASVNLSSTKDDEKTLYAVWKENSYEVIFDYNDGSGAKKTISQTYNAYYVLPATPTRSGYTFAGWWTDETSGSEITSSQKFTNTSGITLYAHWQAIDYQLSFDGYSEYNRCIHYGDKYGKDGWPTPNKSGYTFVGWYFGSTLISAETEFTQTSHQLLSPRFLAKTYQIATKSDNCTITSPTSGYYNSEVSFLWTADSIPGYNIDFVTASISAEDPVLGPVDVTHTATITSRGGYFTMKERYYDSIIVSVAFSKTAKTFEVRFDSNGGTNIEAISVTYDSPYGELPTPTRAGYRFAGWWTDRTGGEEVTAESTVKILETTTLYAHWNYSISFDKGAKSAEGEMDRLTAQCGQKVKLPACGYTRLGYQFVGWIYGESLFADEAEIDELKFSGEEAVLMAKWEEIRQKVTFVANWNGPAGSLVTTKVPDQFELKYGEKKTVYWKPVNTIADFLGWAFESDAEKPDFEVDKDFNAVIKDLPPKIEFTLYAVWAKKDTTLSREVGCDNLILSSESSLVTGYQHKCDPWDDEFDGIGIQSGVIHLNAIGALFNSSYSEVKADLPEAGTLVFTWYVRKNDGGRSSFLIDSKETGVAATETESRVVYSVDKPAKISWRAYGKNPPPFEVPSNLVITSVRWYPAGVNPEPTEEDAPVITADYSFKTDSMFDYVIEAKDALTDAEWTTVSVVTGDGSAIPLPMTPSAEQPQRFFRVRVIRRGTE